MRKYGLSFSLSRLIGLAGLKNKISRKIGVPTTKSGIERKIGRKFARVVFGKW